MNRNDTPIDVFFSILETEFSVGRRAASAVILADRRVKWGRKRRNARQIAAGPGDKRQLTDYVSKSLPGTIPYEALEHLEVSIPMLMTDIVSALRTREGMRAGTDAYAHVAQLLTRDYAYIMIAALEDYACAADIFDNVLDSIRDMEFESMRARASTALALYATAAFLGDMEQAANLTIQFCNAQYGIYLLEEWDPKAAALDEDAPMEMGVQRIIRGIIRGRRHTLEPEGTIFGSLPSTEGDFVADVNNSVSFEHARMFMNERDGKWYVEGLGGRYGTYIERPGVEEAIVVESPADVTGGRICTPVEILPSDVVVMGSTKFEVQLFQHGA
ncbi:MAG: FHA domain-containing protein [Atopobiaceae bacterium]|nr:FHA domain-containing protein [Atopobiaceae bacterium]